MFVILENPEVAFFLRQGLRICSAVLGVASPGPRFRFDGLRMSLFPRAKQKGSLIKNTRAENRHAFVRRSQPFATVRNHPRVCR